MGFSLNFEAWLNLNMGLRANRIKTRAIWFLTKDPFM